MKISDLLQENNDEQVQEGPLGAIGRGLAKGVGGLAKGAGMVAGIGRGLKTAYQKGKATSAAHIGGDVPKQQKPQDPQAQAAYDQEYKRLTTPQPAAQQPAAQQKTEPTMSQEPAAQQEPEAEPAPQQAQQEPKAKPAPAYGQGTPMPTNPAQTPGAQSPSAREQVAGALVDVASSLKSGKDLNDIVGSLEALTKDMKEKPEEYDNPNLVRGTESVQRRGKMVKESWNLFQPRSKVVKESWDLFQPRKKAS